MRLKWICRQYVYESIHMSKDGESAKIIEYKIGRQQTHRGYYRI